MLVVAGFAPINWRSASGTSKNGLVVKRKHSKFFMLSDLVNVAYKITTWIGLKNPLKVRGLGIHWIQ